MKKQLLTLLVLLQSVTASAFTTKTVITTTYRRPMIAYKKPIIVKKPVRHVIKRPIIVYQRPCNVVYYKRPSRWTNVASGLMGFGLGAAMGAAFSR